MKTEFIIIVFLLGVLIITGLNKDARKLRFKWFRFDLWKSGSVPQLNVCAKCKRGDVKLYRPYGGFFREWRVFCCAHVPKEKWDWYIPMIESPDGLVWGYTSVPDCDITKWGNLGNTGLLPEHARGKWYQGEIG